MSRKKSCCLACILLALAASVLCLNTIAEASSSGSMGVPGNSPLNSHVSISADNPVGSPAKYPWEILLRLPVEFNNVSRDRVSVVSFSEEGVPVSDTEGPKSFFVDGDRFFIVDNVNERIVVARGNDIIQYIRTPQDEYGTIIDIYFDPVGRPIILNDSKRHYTLDLDKPGAEIKKISLEEIGKLPVDPNVGLNFKNAYMGSDMVSVLAGNTMVVVDDSVEKPLIRKINNSLIKIGFRVKNHGLEIQSLLKNTHVDIGNGKIKHVGSKTYVPVTERFEMPPGNKITLRTVREYDGEKLSGVAIIRENPLISPNREYYMNAYGDLFQMVISREDLTIYKLRFLDLEEYARELVKRNLADLSQGCKIWTLDEIKNYPWVSHSWGNWYLFRTYHGTMAGETVNGWRRECSE